MEDDALMVVHGTDTLAEAAGRAIARRAREVPRKLGRSVMTGCDFQEVAGELPVKHRKRRR